MAESSRLEVPSRTCVMSCVLLVVHGVEQALVVDRAHGGLANGLRCGQRAADRRAQRRRHQQEPDESGEVAGRLRSRGPSTVLDDSHGASIQDASFRGSTREAVKTRANTKTCTRLRAVWQKLPRVFPVGKSATRHNVPGNCVCTQ